MPTAHEHRRPDFTIADIPIDAIHTDTQNLRELEHDDGIAELAADITHRGLLQPIGVVRTGQRTFNLLWGLRRIRAHRYLTRDTITAKIYPEGSRDAEGDALAENLHREQLTLAEECRAVTHLHTSENPRSPNQIAALLHKSRAWVLQRLALPNLPPDLRDPVMAGDLSPTSAEAIARLDDPAARAIITNAAIHSKLTIPQVREAVQQWQTNAQTQIQPDLNTTIDPNHQAPAPLVTRCALCTTPRLEQELVLLRVCRNGCEDPRKSQPLNPDPHGSALEDQ